MNGKELVFKMAYEGGGFSVFRVKEPDGNINFVEEGTLIDFDENDDEIWRAETHKFATWQEFWAKFTDNKYWYMLCPLYIHDDFKDDMIGNLMKELIKNDSRTSHFENFRKNNWEEALKRKITI